MHRTLILILLLATPLFAQIHHAQKSLAEYQTPYYDIHTDLTGDDLREAALRMTKMAEEYRARTQAFAGKISQKLPFYLFTRDEDYINAGGLEGSVGEFSAADNKLMAVADTRAGMSPWHVIQHEGFHQFAHNVIGGELPIWVNEGLAEYFGEGLFTGDSFITGIIPQDRLDRVKQEMRDKQFRPIREMMLLPHADWNADLTIVNYDQAWSMVHFLAHGDNGKYQSAFVQFMRLIGTSHPWENAWQTSFGSANGFEQKWQKYWLSLPSDPTLNLYAKAATATATSFIARATAQKQKFTDFEDLAAAISKGTIKIDPQDWLPKRLGEEAMKDVAQLRKREIGFTLTKSANPTIVCTLADGKKMTGHFRLNNGRVAQVTVDSPSP